METSIAFCGLDCSNCPIHLATLEEDPDIKARMRIEIADMLAKIYNSTPKPEIICDCDGCKLIGGRLFTGCANCEIRKCAMDNNFENCAYCGYYACDKLKRHFAIDPGAQTNLEKIRGKLKSME
jgi:hypothetical protein